MDDAEETQLVDESVYVTPPLTRAARARTGQLLWAAGDFTRGRQGRMDDRPQSAPPLGSNINLDPNNIYIADGTSDLARLAAAVLAQPPQEPFLQPPPPAFRPRGWSTRSTKRSRAEFSRTLDQTIANTPKRPKATGEEEAGQDQEEEEEEDDGTGTEVLRYADEELVRKAVISLAANIKVIERQVTYDKDPYNFVLFVALEANKVAATHKLSVQQQWNLILDALPVDYRRSYYSMTKNLDELYQVISVLASKILTISDLEKSINSWQLDNSSDKNLVNSVAILMDLLTRSAQHRDRDTQIRHPELFRQAISRIQRDTQMPAHICKALSEARLRIRDNDSMPELNTILFGALNPYIGWKPRGKQSSSQGAIPKVNKVNEKDKKKEQKKPKG
jgi:hypothetical protein